MFLPHVVGVISDSEGYFEIFLETHSWHLNPLKLVCFLFLGLLFSWRLIFDDLQNILFSIKQVEFYFRGYISTTEKNVIISLKKHFV